MACDFDITKENIYDYIIEDTPGADEAIKALSGICSQRADSQWIIAHGELPDNRQLNISSLGYFTIPKLYGLMEGDADISALDEIGALRVLGQDNLQADGSNVLIGYVDTGIDYLNDVFKDRLGNTRIQAIWDQTDRTETDVANTYAHFGRVYEKDEIVTEKIHILMLHKETRQDMERCWLQYQQVHMQTDMLALHQEQNF